MKLTKKELNKIEHQVKTNRRGETWIGFRSTVFNEGTFDKKANREESKKICREYQED